MNRIIVAVDGSAPSLRAAAFAADLADKYGAQLVLVTVGRELSPELTSELETYFRQEHIDAPLSDWRSTHAENVLAGARWEAEARGVKQVSTRSSIGDAAEEIIGIAEWTCAALVERDWLIRRPFFRTAPGL
jgi:nucleotide-binding universal stress UspA family protein